jgi:Dyp-type peroxidase family
MVVGFEPISYRERLRKVLKGLHSARRNVRESELMPPVFGDAVGQFGIIHSFRYSIVPPQRTAAGKVPVDDTWRLALNVTFDGGWEPYMRVIYRDLGTLLDLLLCHTVDYRPSHKVAFDAYCAWVREHEIEGGLFYTDSSATLADQAYLAKLEVMQREGMASELEMARAGLPSAAERRREALAKAASAPAAALVLPLRTLKGLHRLSLYFEGEDHDILSRFARSILQGSRAVMAMLDAKHPHPPAWAAIVEQMTDELALIKPFVDPPAPPPPAVPVDRAALQSHMLAQHEGISHGCVVLLRVSHPAQALAHLSGLAEKCGPLARQIDGIGHLVAFTHAGLAALGVHESRLAALPQEFVDGMEARCGLLGDVRGNHPDYWPLPLAYGMEASGRRIEMKAVHVLVQLRLSDPATESSALHERLQPAIDALQAAASGLRVLAVQATRSYRRPVGTASSASSASSHSVVGHFGFVDGISQPVIDEGQGGAKAVAHSDLVSAGELLLGHANGHGDAANPALDAWLRDGSFLVVRKLRQRVDHLQANLQNLAASEHEGVLARMMGRPKNGDAPVPLPAGSTGPNDFNYDAPGASDACPLHSHTRRANPRDGRAYTPRILRRGMSYGPQSTSDLSSERGVVFMAYCASLAEQFETIQRWVAGGNSSGVSSAQADPFLRVPQAGEKHTFRCISGSGSGARVQRVVFDDQPLVQLEWGLYSLVPSLAVLKKLADLQTAPAPAQQADLPSTAAGEDTALEELRQLLDDPDRAPHKWQQVRADSAQGPVCTPYGRLIGTPREVLAALKDGDARTCSVAGYGQRMAASVGLNHLGQDRAAASRGPHPVNVAIEAITEAAAFDQAMTVVQEALKRFGELPATAASAVKRRPIDLVNFSDLVMAGLCHFWIGLPDSLEPGRSVYMQTGGRKPSHAGLPRCPGNFATASRYIFSPHPRQAVIEEGQTQGQAVQAAVLDWLKGGGPLGTLAVAIQKGLGGSTVAHDVLAPNLAGILLGFPPTVQGNFIKTMDSWIESGVLWELQQSLFDQVPQGPASHAQAAQALRKHLLQTMRRRPVPEMLWRSPVQAGKVNDDPGQRWVLGIASALTDAAAPDELIFGRNRPGAAADQTAHGCPGMAMAMGVLLAMVAGLLQAGTLKPTGSPTLLMLTRHP